MVLAIGLVVDDAIVVVETYIVILKRIITSAGRISGAREVAGRLLP